MAEEKKLTRAQIFRYLRYENRNKNFYGIINLDQNSAQKSTAKIRLSIFVSTLVMKVTEYLCSGGFFFLQTNFDF